MDRGRQWIHLFNLGRVLLDVFYLSIKRMSNQKSFNSNPPTMKSSEMKAMQDTSNEDQQKSEADRNNNIAKSEADRNKGIAELSLKLATLMPSGPPINEDLLKQQQQASVHLKNAITKQACVDVAADQQHQPVQQPSPSTKSSSSTNSSSEDFPPSEKKDNRHRSGAARQHDILSKMSELSQEKCAFYYRYSDDKCPATVSDIDEIFDLLDAYNHFASRAPIIVAKGRVSAKSQYGPATVFAKHPLLLQIHKHVVANHLPKGSIITSLKFLKHDGTSGTKGNAIPLDIDNESDNEDTSYSKNSNTTSAHHDYLVLRSSKYKVVGVKGATNSFNKNGSQQQQGRNATLIVNLGGSRLFQFETDVELEDLPRNTKTTVPLTHSSVVSFGILLNAIATHCVLNGGMGKRLSLVYEYALRADSFSGIHDEVDFFDRMWMENSNFTRSTIVQDVQVKVEK